MSMETRASGGRWCMPNTLNGGVCASMQSIGATGVVKAPAVAKENLIAFQDRANDLLQQYRQHQQQTNLLVLSASHIELPPYFTVSPSGTGTEKAIINYRVGGYNMCQAEKMLKESILPLCRTTQTRCSIGRYRVVGMQRLENASLFQKFNAYENKVAMKVPLFCPTTNPDIHSWLKKLAEKNELSPAANTVYLLHGTKPSNLVKISNNGLTTQAARQTGTYGQGIYFTDSRCKAHQYGDGMQRLAGRRCILICRVVLEHVKSLDRERVGQQSSPDGYHSCMAKRDQRDRQQPQLHNEFVVFDDYACYPEFALSIDSDIC